MPIIKRRLLKQFAVGVTARAAAELVGVNRNKAILYFHKLLEIIAKQKAANHNFLLVKLK